VHGGTPGTNVLCRGTRGPGNFRGKVGRGKTESVSQKKHRRPFLLNFIASWALVESWVKLGLGYSWGDLRFVTGYWGPGLGFEWPGRSPYHCWIGRFAWEKRLPKRKSRQAFLAQPARPTVVNRSLIAITKSDLGDLKRQGYPDPSLRRVLGFAKPSQPLRDSRKHCFFFKARNQGISKKERE